MAVVPIEPLQDKRMERERRSGDPLHQQLHRFSISSWHHPDSPGNVRNILAVYFTNISKDTPVEKKRKKDRSSGSHETDPTMNTTANTRMRTITTIDIHLSLPQSCGIAAPAAPQTPEPLKRRAVDIERMVIF